jgi:maltooligosyltrehalose trehalohydrolase
MAPVTVRDSDDQIDTRRRLPVGAEPVAGGVHFRVWAPAVAEMDVVLVRSGDAPRESIEHVQRLARDADGYHEAAVESARPGDLYMFRLDGDRLRPDPASRYQPAGPHGPSMIVDPHDFEWTVNVWPAPGSRPDVVYEMHVGTFSPDGTWRGALPRLQALADVGVTIIEMMPVAEFSGRHGWGYDGVSLFAPHHHYGRPDDLRRFVDEAHRLGMAVVLDVVYNHCGPDGCYLQEFAPQYFSSTHEGEWGAPLNFDGDGREGSREFVIANGKYWITEFRFDGLRLDATQAIFDDSQPHLIAELIAGVRSTTPRRLWFVSENEPQQSRLVRDPAAGGYGGDALWNDDFHHTAVVAATGRREAYYTDYEGGPQEFVSAAKYGFLYQGQHYSWQEKGRGSPALDLPAATFVCFLENHDQVANSIRGRRLHQETSPARFRALTATLLLGPWIPMLFQGQEWGTETPFLYFADLPEGLREGVTSGRREFLSQFPGSADAATVLDDPSRLETFERCRLEAPVTSEIFRLHQDLIRLRSANPAIVQPADLDGAVLGPHAFLWRFFSRERGADRLLLVNLGASLQRAFVPEPLLAPPAGTRWRRAWDSERPEYGGNGIGDIPLLEGLRLPAECALLLVPEPALPAQGATPDTGR